VPPSDFAFQRLGGTGYYEQTLFDFYHRRVPAEVASARHFDRWWKTAGRDNPDLLDLSVKELTNDAAGVTERDYPSFWSTSTPGASEPAKLALKYEFEPGTPTDGVSVDVPLALLNQVDEAAFSWQIPGHREELVTALIRSLRKDLRRNFVPVPDTVRAALARMDPARGSLTEELSRVLREMFGVTVPSDAWRWDHVPEHLRVSFRVVGDDGSVVGTGKDMGAVTMTGTVNTAGEPRMGMSEASAEPRCAGPDFFDALCRQFSEKLSVLLGFGVVENSRWRATLVETDVER